MSDEQKSRLTLYLLAAIVAAVTLAFVRPELAMRFETAGRSFSGC